jgi:hypothetical protein
MSANVEDRLMQEPGNGILWLQEKVEDGKWTTNNEHEHANDEETMMRGHETRKGEKTKGEKRRMSRAVNGVGKWRKSK